MPVVALPMARGVVVHEPFGVELGVVERLGEAAHLVGRGGHECSAAFVVSTARIVCRLRVEWGGVGRLRVERGLRRVGFPVGCARVGVSGGGGGLRRVGFPVGRACVGGCGLDFGGGVVGRGRFLLLLGGGERLVGDGGDCALYLRNRCPLLLPDDGRRRVARAGPFSTWGKGDYRGMGYFILFSSFLLCSGGGRIFVRGGGRLVFGGEGIGRVRFFLLLGGWEIVFGGEVVSLLAGLVVGIGGQGVVGRQATHRTAVGLGGRAHPPHSTRASRGAPRRRGVGSAQRAHRIERRRGEGARRAVDVEETELLHHAAHRSGVLVEVEGQQVVVERGAAVRTVAQVGEQHDVDADARGAHAAAQTAAVADAVGARIERKIGGEDGHEGRKVFRNV